MTKHAKKAAKRTGPSKRTQAQRDAINKRAATWKPGAPRPARGERAARQDGKPGFGAGEGASPRVSSAQNRGKAPSSRPSPRARGEGGRPSRGRRTITIAGQPTRWPREIKVGDRHRKDMGDLVGLAKSIDERGALLQPIVIDKDSNLIAGQRRLAAWPLTRFRKEPIPVTIVDIDAIVAGEWDENAKRKDFTLSECVSIMEALRPVAEAKAKERQVKGKKAATADGLDAKGAAADLLAAYVGKDRKTLSRAKEVIEAAQRDPEKFGKLVDDMNRTGRVNGPYKRLSNIQSGEALRAAPPPLPMHGPYHTVAIDFPWPADLDGYRDPETRGYYPYKTMSIDDICAYAARKIVPILQENAAVWLFIPNFHLVRGCHVRVLEALGVQGSTMLTGVKSRLGQGQRLRGTTEHAILAVKGSVPVLGTEQGTSFDWPVKGAHSAKPQAFFDIVEKVTPAPRYAFLFAGGSVPEGWDGHGDRIGQGAAGEESAPEAATNIPENIPAAEIETEFNEFELLKCIEHDHPITDDARDWAKAQKLARGSVKLKLTKAGIVRLKVLREEAAAPKPAVRVRCPEGNITSTAIDVLVRKADDLPFRMVTPANEERTNLVWLKDRQFLVAQFLTGEPHRGAIVIARVDGRLEIESYIGGDCKHHHGADIPLGKVDKLIKAWGKAPVTVSAEPLEPGGFFGPHAVSEIAAKLSLVDCRVCSDGTGLCAQCVAAADHVVSFEVDGEGWNVGTCTCGFMSRFPRTEQLNLDAAIKAHWQNVVTEAKAAASSTADADEIPASIKRGPDNVAPYQREAAE